MTPDACDRSSKLAALLVTISLWFLPAAKRSRYCREWMAELEEMERQRIAQLLPALRILLSAPAVGRALGTPHRQIIMGIGDRLFAMNDTEGYFRNWQIARLARGLRRRYRDQRFDLLTQCGTCHGSGTPGNMPCTSCRGTGRVASKMR